VGISLNLQLQCSWGQRWTVHFLWSKGRRSRSQQEHTWSNKHSGRHFLTCLQNAQTHSNETYRS